MTKLTSRSFGKVRHVVSEGLELQPVDQLSADLTQARPSRPTSPLPRTGRLFSESG